MFHEPYVTNGYRPIHFPLKNYFLSIFQLHNESLNVWTHLAAFFAVTYKAYELSKEIDLVNDPHAWPIVAGLFCAGFLYLSSSGAHLLHSMSELMHYTAFMVDYAGIGLYGMGSILLHISIISEQNFFDRWHHWYPLFGIVLSLAVCLCCTLAKVMYTRPYPFSRKIWQITPVLLIYIVLIAPVIHRLYTCSYTATDSCKMAEDHHKLQILYFIICGFFFTIDFPQRIHNGLCNYVMHSHSIFHIFIGLCTVKQFDAVHVEFMSRYDELHSRPTPSIFSAFGPVLLCIFGEFSCIFLFRNYMRSKLAKRSS